MTTIANLLVEVGADISGMTSGLNDASNKIDNFATRAGTGLTNLGSSLTGLGAQFTALTAPLAIAGGAGIKLASDFQSTMTEISARTGIVGTDLETLRGFALQMGADTAFSGQQAADAMLQLLTSGSSATEAMALLPAVMDAASASGEDLGGTADVLTDIMASFGIDAEYAGDVVDSLAKAAGASSADMASLGQGFGNVGGVAKNFGLSMNRTAAILAIFSENGIKGAEAGTNLKSMLLAMSNDTDETTAAWEELGTSLYDGEGNMRDFEVVISELDAALDQLPLEEQNRLMRDLAGSYGITGLTALRGGLGISEMEGKMAESAGASEVAQARMSTFAGSVDSLKGSVETLLIQAMTPFMEDVLTPLAGQLTGIVNNVTDWVEENPELTSTIVGIGAALLTVGPILAGVGIAMGVVGTAVTGLGAALGLLLSPIGIAIAAGAALALAYETNFMGLKDTVDNVFGGIKTTIEGIFGGGKGEIDGSMIGIKNMGAAEQSEPLQMLAAGLSEALTTIETVVTTVWANIQPGIASLQEGITGFFAAFENTDTEGLDGAVGGIVGFIGGLVEAAANIGSQVFSALLDNVGNALPMIGQGISDFVSAISALGAGDAEGGLIGLGDVITSFVNALLDFAQIEIEIPDFSAAVEGWRQFFSDLGIIIDAGKTVIEGVFDDIATGIRTFVRDIEAVIIDLRLAANDAQIAAMGLLGQDTSEQVGLKQQLTLESGAIDIASQLESDINASLAAGGAIEIDLAQIQYITSGEADANFGTDVTEALASKIADPTAIQAAIQQAISTGDTATAMALVPLGLTLSEDPATEMQELLNVALENGGPDGEAFQALLPMATELGIDTAEIETQFQTALEQAAGAHNYGVNITTDIHVTPGSVVFDAQMLGGAIAGTVGAGIQVGAGFGGGAGVSGGSAVPMLASGGDITSEGLAYLHAGETVLNPQEAAAYNGGASNGGQTVNINGVQDVDALLFELARRGIRLGAN